MRKLTVLLALCALAPFALTACGDDDEEEPTEATTTEETTGGGGGGAPEAVAVSAASDNSFAFDQDSLAAPAGEVIFEFDNPASLGHDFCVEDGGELGCTEVISESTTTLTVDLDAGEYTFYCDVAGHREGGMEGTLTVK